MIELHSYSTPHQSRAGGYAIYSLLLVILRVSSVAMLDGLQILFPIPQKLQGYARLCKLLNE